MNSIEANAIEKVAKELHELNKKLDRIHKDVMHELKARRPSTLNEEREKMGFEQVHDIGRMAEQVVYGDEDNGHMSIDQILEIAKKSGPKTDEELGLR